MSPTSRVIDPGLLGVLCVGGVAVGQKHRVDDRAGPPFPSFKDVQQNLKVPLRKCSLRRNEGKPADGWLILFFEFARILLC